MRERAKTLGTGLLAGLIAVLLMTVVMATLRYFFGVASTFEMIGDRFAPLIPLALFQQLLQDLGGYDQLKQLGTGSTILGQIVAGALGGAAYALVVGRAAGSEAQQRFGRPGASFVAGLVGIAWLATLALLWPVLGTSPLGLPQGTARIVTALGLLFSYAVYGVGLILAYRYVTGRAPTGRMVPSGTPRVGRRAFLAGTAGAVFALGSGALFRRLFDQSTFSYDGLRAGVEGTLVQPITPNDEFYCVTKNVVDPRVEKSVWRLDVNGLVENPRTYTFEEIAAMPGVVEQETTLSCISNPVGGRLMSNAIWTGVPLRDIIEEAGQQEGVVEVLLHGVDGYTDTFAIEKALDPTTLLAFEMNGEPLPDRHGFPARIIVPGLFGEKNVKWVTRIQLVDYDAKGFYETQGWGPNFVQPIRSRFDAPDFNQTLNIGETVVLAGIAYAGDRGVEGVEVSTDGGESWQDARLTYRGNRLSWSLWDYDWTPEEPGEFDLLVRATDGDGELQTSEFRRALSGMGATGLHAVTARVEA